MTVPFPFRGALAVLALCCFAPGQSGTTTFTAPDGSRFVLSPDDDASGAPIVHWICASPAGPDYDPVGVEGLSIAVARASLDGTRSIGGIDPTQEARLLEQEDELSRRLAATVAQGQSPSPDDVAALRQVQADLQRTADSSAWRRAVLAAPAVSVELEVLAEATLLHVVTDNAALQRVAELIVARRENAVLRGLRGQFAAVRAGLRKTAAGPEARLRREVIGLARLGDPRAREQADHPADWSRQTAVDVFRATHQPTNTLHVLTGRFDSNAVRQILTGAFDRTDIPPRAKPTPTARSSGTNRLSTVPTTGRRAIAISCELPSAFDRTTAEVLADWLAGTDESFLPVGLRTQGLTEIDVSFELPFPANSRDGMLLIQAVERRPPETKVDPIEPKLRALIARMLTDGPVPSRLNRAIRRVETQHLLRVASAESRARYLAEACGIQGLSVDAAMTPFEAPELADVTKLASQLFLTSERTVVTLENTTPR